MYRSYTDQTLGYFDRAHVGVPDGAVADPASWCSSELDDGDWTIGLDADERVAWATLGRDQVASGRPLAELTDADIRAPALAAVVDRCRTDLDGGRGFILLRGAPVEEMSGPEVEGAFWAFGLLLGEPGAQNGAGDLLGHVRDHHDDPGSPLSREYRTTVDINFHCDAADAVGLLCLAPAASGGESRLVSSVAVFNQLVTERPDLAARLCQEAELDTRSDGEGFDHVPVRPVCFDGARLRTFMHLGYFRSAARHPGVTVDDRLAEALDRWEAIASDPAHHLDMVLRPGDVQLCSNHTIAHARRAYVDDPGEPRHLLRLWLTL